MVKTVVRIVVVFVVAVSGLMLGTHSGQAVGTQEAGFVGRVSNQTYYDITAVRFNTAIDHDNCTVWNGMEGGPYRQEPYTFTICQRYNIGAGTTSGLLLDLDGFRPALSYPASHYEVRFKKLVGWGPWNSIDWFHYTRITDSQKATCRQASSNSLIQCDVE